VQIDTRSGPYFITNPGADSTAATITEPVPTTTAPSGDGTIKYGSKEGGLVPNGVVLLPYGTGSATNTFTMKVYGWEEVFSKTFPLALYVPRILASFTCTLCTQTGVAGYAVDNTHLFCGTISLAVGNANVSNEVISPTGNVIASIMLDLKGATYLGFVFSTGSSATACNCLCKAV